MTLCLNRYYSRKSTKRNNQTDQTSHFYLKNKSAYDTLSRETRRGEGEFEQEQTMEPHIRKNPPISKER